MEKKFNLLDEPWIRVLTEDTKTIEVSLTELFKNAHKYRRLACEMPTVDISILRLLLAVALTVFYRYDAEGNYDELEESENDPDDVLERWEEYMDRGCFNGEVFEKYLETYRERFWLVHPETPFNQVPKLQYGTSYGVQSLVGNIKESKHEATRHHFSIAEQNELEMAEAARWLINLQGYAVNIKYDKKAPGTKEAVGTGRMGQMGLLYVDALNIYELIMRNLIALRDGEELWARPSPCWEREVVVEQGRCIVMPNNLPELYTIQSRRVSLLCDKEMIIGFRAIGGDFFPLDNSFCEQMTIWKVAKEDKKSGQKVFAPKTINNEESVWREFPYIFYSKKTDRTPGLVLWMERLYEYKLIPQNTILTFGSVSFEYGNRSYTYGKCSSDSLALSSDFLGKLGNTWVALISDEIEKCKCVSQEGFLYVAKCIAKLFYGENNDKKREILRSLSNEYYSAIDFLFREWLSRIKPEESERDKLLTEWEKLSRRSAINVMENYVYSMRQKTFEYREDGKNILSIPQIEREFKSKIYRIYPNIIEGDEQGEEK